MDPLLLRTIQEPDNPLLAKIIREALAEFGANRPGTVYFDDTTDRLFELFQKKGSIYFVVTHQDKVLGGAGIFPLEGLAGKTCELVKMYLSPKSRGSGIGKRLLTQCLDYAKAFGYQQVYIETMPELTIAIGMYTQFGFRFLKSPLGSTGHFGCEVWMLKDL
jgi:putative acetyltransferase